MIFRSSHSKMNLYRWVLAFFIYLAASAAIACTGAENVTATKPVDIDFNRFAYLRYIEPLRVLSVNVPPMSEYNEKDNGYRGISADVLCYLSKKTGVRIEYIINDDPLNEKIAAVQQGKADMFMPLSYTQTRAAKGIFSLPYYNSYYALLALSKNQIIIDDLSKLKDYTVGIISRVSMEPLLNQIVPGNRVKSYARSDGPDGMFNALRHGEIDVALYNKDIFTEKRFALEFFDIEPIYTVGSVPQEYRFYFHDTPENRYIVKVFNEILSAVDITYSIQKHRSGEEQLIERYLKQRSQRSLLQIGALLIAVLAVIFVFAYFRHMRLIKQLEIRNHQIRKQQKELEYLSLTDTLTGIPNRRMFDQVIIKEHARLERSPSPLSLIMLDIDDFKMVNDTFGHTIGDDYLRAVADVLRHSVKRKTDLIARYGGEEFICLLPDTSISAASKIAERIRLGVEDLKLPNPGANPPELTISLGVACLHRYDCSIKNFINAVDSQLYIAKKAGKNQFASIEIN